jgi:hypothetical protein
LLSGDDDIVVWMQTDSEGGLGQHVVFPSN